MQLKLAKRSPLADGVCSLIENIVILKRRPLSMKEMSRPSARSLEYIHNYICMIGRSIMGSCFLQGIVK